MNGFKQKKTPHIKADIAASKSLLQLKRMSTFVERSIYSFNLTNVDDYVNTCRRQLIIRPCLLTRLWYIKTQIKIEYDHLSLSESCGAATTYSQQLSVWIQIGLWYYNIYIIQERKCIYSKLIYWIYLAPQQWPLRIYSAFSTFEWPRDKTTQRRLSILQYFNLLSILA